MKNLFRLEASIVDDHIQQTAINFGLEASKTCLLFRQALVRGPKENTTMLSSSQSVYHAPELDNIQSGFPAVVVVLHGKYEQENKGQRIMEEVLI